MNEATKTRRLWGEDVLRLLSGDGIDIGCGPDPILPGVDRFDQAEGDANRILESVKRRYDFVFSSHTLEHMHDPPAAIRDWFSLVKPGGHLIVLVPDEDLYEQGCFPSLFNRDHKHTFTISKNRSWSPVSINLLDLAETLGGEVVQVRLQDDGYDRRWLRHAPGLVSRTLFRSSHLVRRLDPFGWIHRIYRHALGVSGAVVDQTAFDDARLAQIQLIVRKPGKPGETASL